MLQRLIHAHLITAFLAIIRVFFRRRVETSLEVLALRQQVAVLQRKRPRLALNRLDRYFWTTLRQIGSRWSDVLIIVKPETVVGWHRAGLRLYWRWRPRPRGGRPKVNEEIRALIRRMVAENSGWGAPKIHGELLKLGLEVSERTVARYLQRLRRRGDPVWSENSTRSYRRPFSGLSVGCGMRQCPAGPAFLTQEYAIGPVLFR